MEDNPRVGNEKQVRKLQEEEPIQPVQQNKITTTHVDALVPVKPGQFINIHHIRIYEKDKEAPDSTRYSSKFILTYTRLKPAGRIKSSRRNPCTYLPPMEKIVPSLTIDDAHEYSLDELKGMVSWWGEVSEIPEYVLTSVFYQMEQLINLPDSETKTEVQQ